MTKEGARVFEGGGKIRRRFGLWSAHSLVETSHRTRSINIEDSGHQALIPSPSSSSPLHQVDVLISRRRAFLNYLELKQQTGDNFEMAWLG